VYYDTRRRKYFGPRRQRLGSKKKLIRERTGEKEMGISIENSRSHKDGGPKEGLDDTQRIKEENSTGPEERIGPLP